MLVHDHVGWRQSGALRLDEDIGIEIAPGMCAATVLLAGAHVDDRDLAVADAPHERVIANRLSRRAPPGTGA